MTTDLLIQVVIGLTLNSLNEQIRFASPFFSCSLLAVGFQKNQG